MEDAESAEHMYTLNPVGAKVTRADYDLICTPHALRAAAVWANHSGDATLERYDSNLAVVIGSLRQEFPCEPPVAALETVTLTSESLAAAAGWVRGNAPVTLLVDEQMLLVTQSSRRTAFDTDGSVGSKEYLALAPLDR